MKNRGIIIFLIILAAVIIAIVAIDFVSKRPDKIEANPFGYDISELKVVPPKMILYKETKNFKIGFEEPAGITINKGKIYLVGDKQLKIIDLSGKLLSETNMPGKPKTVESFGKKIFVAFQNKIVVFNQKGNQIEEWNLPEKNVVITAVAVQNGDVFVADAGGRRVVKFSEKGEELGEFNGRSRDSEFGFVVPSPYFDIDINADGELWVVNPGMHSLENYTFDGKLRTYWQNASMKTEGFSGCCNPAHFTFLNNGSFITSEKGLVRIKVYKPSGEFEGVVAAPDKFVDSGHAPDVATDSKGNIYALDFDRKIVRVFELKKGKTP